MSSNISMTQYNYSSGVSGSTEAGTSFGANFGLNVQAGTDFTDESAFTVFDAILAALQSVGWEVTAADITMSKVVLDDTSYTPNTTAKTFS